MRNVQIRKFIEADLQNVSKLIQNTIEISYPGVYPKEAVQFFKGYHSKEHILADAAKGYTIVAESDCEVVGTGTLLDTNIRRVFISPLYHHEGIGKLVFRELEKKASLREITTLNLESSLISIRFWESMGFQVQREDFIPVENQQKLSYFKMVKTLNDFG